MRNRHDSLAVLDREDEMQSPRPIEIVAGRTRIERRFIVNQPARLSTPGSGGSVCEARIRDISRHGMQFVLDRPIQGPRVTIKWNGREIDGTVRYQENDQDGCRLGVEISSSWESLVSDVLEQQSLELARANRALQQQTAILRRAEKRVVAYAKTLAQRNEELSHALDTARQASTVKSRFLASVSHELRTPLNGIVGFAQLLYDRALGPVSDLQRECLGDVLSCSDHLLTLIGHLLDLTRIESGKMTFQYETVSLARLITEVVDTLQPIADSKQIEVEFQPDTQLDSVLADPGRLKQILYNYLSNALKFTGRGGQIKVSVTEEGASYRIDVSDSGIGIAPDDILRLFSEFSQVGASEQSKAGCGLGLAVSKQIAEAQGGRVGVESEVGKGSKFYVVLPRVLQTSTLSVSQPAE